jgi:hypothetical protein
MEFWGASIVNAITGLTCLLIGFLMKKFKATRFIAGYNTMNQKQKETWNEKELLNASTRLSYSLGICLIIGAILSIILNRYMMVVLCSSWLIFVGLIIFNMIHVNTSKKFRSNK